MTAAEQRNRRNKDMKMKFVLNIAAVLTVAIATSGRTQAEYACATRDLPGSYTPNVPFHVAITVHIGTNKCVAGVEEMLPVMISVPVFAP